MSYDIYGNLLQRGHCEVHPHVHEEYPCSVCMQESNNRNAQQRSESDHYEIMSLEHGLELSQQRIAELEAQLREAAKANHLSQLIGERNIFRRVSAMNVDGWLKQKMQSEIERVTCRIAEIKKDR